MYESKSEPGKKFGSKFRGKRFDSYHAGEQPEKKAEPQETGTKDRARANHVHYSHDHEANRHIVTRTLEDGTQSVSEHHTAAEAYEAGGDEQATDVKRRNHPDQQGAESEERNYVMPPLA
jgi:hypothetical protein